jgi:superfamily II DNA/RNA helicase
VTGSRGLVLLPTRELASQVREVLLPLARAMGLSVTAVFGGTAQGSQVTALRDRTDIVVACPGRLADLIEQGHCHLGDVEVTVLDEADHMADLGFLPVVRRLLEATPTDGQRMLFTATLDTAVNVLARRFLNEPARHAVDSAAPPAQISHHLLTVSPADRLAVICALAGGRNRSLVFTRTRHGARKLARQLARAGVVPHAVTAGPHSPVLRSITGPSAERVMPASRRRGEGRPLATGNATGPGPAAVSARSGGHWRHRRR